MNLLDTGKFIKEQRKQNNLTQAQLANKIMVSEKTISKWECGNGFPDTNLMLPLCQALNISANELLSGKKLNENEYKQEAENNLVLLNEQKIKTSKFIFTLEIVLGLISTIAFLALLFTAVLAPLPVYATALLIVIGALIFFVGIHFCIIIEKDVGFYECKYCHHKHIPTLKQTYYAMHLGRTRYLKCPKCNKNSWQKKVLK